MFYESHNRETCNWPGKNEDPETLKQRLCKFIVEERITNKTRISGFLGVPPDTVDRLLEELGNPSLDLPREELEKAMAEYPAASRRQLAKIIGITKSQVDYLVKKYGLGEREYRPTPELSVRDIKRLINQGLGLTKIAKELKTTNNVLKRFMLKNGIAVPQRKRQTTDIPLASRFERMCLTYEPKKEKRNVA